MAGVPDFEDLRAVQSNGIEKVFYNRVSVGQKDALVSHLCP